MAEVSPLEKEKLRLFRKLGTLISLVVLAAIIWGVFGYGFKTCDVCSGIGKFIVSCRWCDGDGKVSFWKVILQSYASTRSGSSAPERNYRPCWKCTGLDPSVAGKARSSCTVCSGTGTISH